MEATIEHIHSEYGYVNWFYKFCCLTTKLKERGIIMFKKLWKSSLLISIIGLGIYLGTYTTGIQGINGETLLLQGVTAVNENMVLNASYEPEDMIEYEVKKHQDALSNILKLINQYVTIQIVKKNREIEDVNEPRIYVEYFNEKNSKIFSGIRFNEEYLSIMRSSQTFKGNALTYRSIPMGFIGDYDSYKDMLPHMVQIKANYVNLKENIGIKYTYEEYLTLNSFFGVARKLNQLAQLSAKKFHLKKAEKIYSKRGKLIEENYFLAFAEYLVVKHYWYVVLQNSYTYFFVGITIITIFFLALLLFRKEDINSVLKDKMEKYGLNLSSIQIWEFKLRHCFYLFRIGNIDKVNQKVEDFCKPIKDSMVDKNLKKQGKEYFTKLRDAYLALTALEGVNIPKDNESIKSVYTDFGHWMNVYLIIKGDLKKSDKERFEKLSNLTARLNRLEWVVNNYKTNPNKKSESTNSTSQNKPKRDNNKEELTQTIKSYIDDSSYAVQARKMNPNNLRELLYVLNYLTQIKVSTKLFMGKHVELMKDDSFLNAISTHNRKIVKEKLGLIKKLVTSKKTNTKTKKEDYSKIFDGKKVYIVGCHDKRGAQVKYERIVLDLGAVKALYINANNADGLRSLNNLDEDAYYLFTPKKTSHNAYWKVKKASNLIYLNLVNSTKIKKEIIEKMKK